MLVWKSRAYFFVTNNFLDIFLNDCYYTKQELKKVDEPKISEF